MGDGAVRLGQPRSQKLLQLRRKLLEDYDVPVHADDELLGLAATMLEMLELAQDSLERHRQQSFESQKAAVAQASRDAVAQARQGADQMLVAASQACEQIGMRATTATDRLESCVARHEAAIRYATWLNAGFALVATLAAVIALSQ